MDRGRVDDDAEHPGVPGQSGDLDEGREVAGPGAHPAPTGSAPRLVPAAGSTARSSSTASSARAAATGSDGAESTTGARSSTPSRAARRGRRARCRPRQLARARWRRSRGRPAPPRRSPSRRDRRTWAGCPSRSRGAAPPGRGCTARRREAGRRQVVEVRGVPSGVTSMPSSVVRVSFPQTRASSSSSASRRALRSTAAAAFSQSDRRRSSSAASASEPCSGSSSVGSSRPPSISVMVRTIGVPLPGGPPSVMFPAPRPAG